MNPIQSAISEHKPVKIFAMYSGGDGSLASTHYAMNHGAHEVLHISTGIGVNEPGGLSVLEVVRETCRKYGWPLRIETPPDLDYRGMVLRFGFPGPGAHLYPYVWLKDRAIAKVVRETKRKVKDRVGLSTGVRNGDSARRMGYITPIVRKGARVWIAPLFNWNTIEMYEYIKENEIQRSPIAKLIGMSGECFCGAFAQPNEIEKIEKYFPALATQIHILENEAKEKGVPCKWGVRPPMRRNKNQVELPFLPMCVNCHGQSNGIW